MAKPKALISVTDKSGVVGFAQSLVDLGWEILSTGGTARVLKEANVPVTRVSNYTDFPEMFDGRVKTLHPKIHGGILARRDDPIHRTQMEIYHVPPIDLVCVNLYQFEKAIARKDCTLEEAIEQIDIGGPAMLRSSAKNFKSVTVITDPADYPRILGELQEHGKTSLKLRFELAKKVFALTHAYDGAISRYLKKVSPPNED
jgi:phosphoribosylaminoimidazolecarboxamide formyltransferase/IMP cyclohydrolase